MSKPVLANILDPIHDFLAPQVWDDPASPKPKLKEQHRKWIRKTIHQVLADAGYTHIDKWLSLVFTGSLTTYQYDKGSDCDISLFVDSEHFPEWSRAEMIGVMISHIDGRKLPGTPYPMQCFVVPSSVTREQLYQPGLRSGYDLSTSSWIVPPEKDRAMDVESQLPGFYAYALEQADKMEALLRYEPEKAKLLWHQIHNRRREDQRAGKGDYASSNIVYKFLANRGLFPAIAEATGEYIAKLGNTATVINHRLDQSTIDLAAQHLGIRNPVKVVQVDGTHGRYHGTDQSGQHLISVVGWLKPESASKQLWHELAHAHQAEHGEDVMNIPTTETHDFDTYNSHPLEVEAREWAEREPFPVALKPHRFAVAPGHRPQTAKFAYDPVNQVGMVGEMGRVEGEKYSHAQLAEMLKNQVGSDSRDLCFGEVNEHGQGALYGRPRLKGPGKGEMNPYQANYEATIFAQKAIPGAQFRDVFSSDGWGQIDPQVLYAGKAPTLQNESPIEEPSEGEVWTF